jgi:hypothetical protein
MKSRAVPKETLHAAIRDVIAANGGERIGYRDFLIASGMKQRDIFHHYSRWQEALCGAGFNFKPYHRPVSPGALLAEWGAVVRKLRRLPTQAEYRIHGPREGTLVGRQFGSWLNMPAAFRHFARRKCKVKCNRKPKRNEWADTLELLDSLPKEATRPATTSRPRFVREPRTPKAPPRKMRDRPEYGELLDIPALRHAPVNESGVIYLFGILAERLGFTVKHMQNDFPDCQAMRRTGRRGCWQEEVLSF